MQMQNDQQDMRGNASYGASSRDNSNYTDATVIQIRLDTNPILEKIQVFLSGELTVYESDEQGRVKKKLLSKGRKKCNDEGLQAILSFVTSVVNPQTVQGNYEIQQYKEHCFYMRNELTKQIIINLYRWEIHTREAESIIDFIMNIVEPFLSRLIDNKERESYSQSLQVKENSSYEPRSRGIFSGLFGGGR